MQQEHTSYNMSNFKENTLKENIDSFAYINAAIAVIILLLNGFAVLIFSQNKLLLRVVSNRILLSLAIGDFLSGSVIGVHLLITLVACSGCIVLRIFTDISMTVLVNASVLHMLCIATDRYLGLFYALRYEQIFTAKKAKIFITISWTVSGIFPLLQLFWLYPVLDGISAEENKRISCNDAVFSTVSFLTFMMIPMLILVIMFIKMFREIRRLLHQTPRHSQSPQYNIWEEFKAISMFLAMFMTFATLSVPYYVVRLIIDVKHIGHIINFDIGNLVYQVAYVLKNLAPISSPLLYILCNQDFRLAIRKCFRKLRRKISDTRSIVSIRYETSIRRSRAVTFTTHYSSIEDSAVITRRASTGDLRVFAVDKIKEKAPLPVFI